MFEELQVQQVIQYADTKRIDRIIYVDKDSGVVTTIEMYRLYNENEWLTEYERRKLNQKRIDQLEREQGKPAEEWQLEKLKEEQVNSNMATKAKQAKFIEGISNDDSEKFCLVTSMEFHQIRMAELVEAIQQNKVQCLCDFKDRSIEELVNRHKQDIREEIEKNSKEMKSKNQGAKRYESKAEQRYSKWNEEMENAYDICQKVFNKDSIPRIYNNGRSIGEIVKKLAKQYNMTKKTVYKHLRRYLQGGGVKYALYNDYYIGNAIKNKIVTKHIGRKSTGATKDCETGVIITDEMKKLFAFSICRWYETKGGHSLQSTYKMLKNELFKQEKESEEGIKTGVLPIPTYRQFTYWYNKEYKDVSRSIINREGEKYFLNNKKGQFADILSEVTGPMQLVYVDATIVDIYLIDRETGKEIVYRPTLYLSIDCFTSMVVGVSITLEPPGIMPLRTLLYNMLQDKQLYAKEFGVKFKKEYWPAQGMPRIIMGDRGEMISPDFETIIKDFNSTFKNTAPYLGAAKGLVEQVFNTVNMEVNEWAPGYVDKHYNSRRQPDYRLDAKLDLRAFTQIIIKMIIHHNRKSIANRKPTPEMVREGIKMTPIGLWEYGKKFSGVLPNISTERVIIKLLREAEVSLGQKGIRFRGGYYNAEHPDFYKWKTEARVGGVKKFVLRYDNRCLNHIFLINLEEESMIRCMLDLNFHESRNLQDKSYEEVVAYEEEVKKIADSQAREQIENDNEFANDRESIIEEQVKVNKDIKLSLKDSKNYKHKARAIAKRKNTLTSKLEGSKETKPIPQSEGGTVDEVDAVQSMDDLLAEFASELLEEMRMK